MYKCKIAEAAAIAIALGFSGAQTDPVAVKAFLVEKNPTVNGPDGKPIDLKSLEIEGESKAFTLAFTPNTTPAMQASAGQTFTPADFDLKVKSAVDEAIKSAGLSKVRRPGPVADRDAPVGVKSGEQREYEDRIEDGKAFCKSYAVAKGMHLWMQARTAQAWSDHPTYEQSTKQFGEWASQVTDGQKAYDTFTAASAGNSVPELFQAELIRNVLDYGIYPQLCRVVQMPGPQMTWTQRTGGVTGSYPAELVAPSVTTATLNNITLNAKTFQTLQQASRQILTDSGISMMEWIMAEAAMAIAKQKDDCLIIGNGGSTYAGATGYEFKYGVTASDGGYQVVGGADTTAHTVAQIDSLMARLPQNYRANSAFTGSPEIVSMIFDRLASTGAPGLTWTEHETLGYVRTWRGRPIIENNSMSSVLVASTTNRAGFTAGDQIDLLYGDFSKAAFFGELQSMEVEISKDAGMTTNSTYVAVRARFDNNVYNIGSSTAAGAVVSFWQT